MKKCKITLQNKETQELITMECHHWYADSDKFTLCGVKGIKGYTNNVYFDREHFERIKGD